MYWVYKLGIYVGIQRSFLYQDFYRLNKKQSQSFVLFFCFVFLLMFVMYGVFELEISFFFVKFICLVSFLFLFFIRFKFLLVGLYILVNRLLWVLKIEIWFVVVMEVLILICICVFELDICVKFRWEVFLFLLMSGLR